ncbi:MAG: hypothetical protein JO276_11840, partial [Sphingomonadaceae bacterium]|nr:hypothetical protein [Sphingomonadaceae bacterium]
MKKLIAALTGIAAISLTAQPAEARTYAWQCNLGGQPARLVAQVEYVGGGGVTYGPGSGVVSDGSANLVYS